MRATSQHFTGSLGREQISRELDTVCSGGSHSLYTCITGMCILRLCFVWTLSVHSCSSETQRCRGGGEPACMFSLPGSQSFLFFFFVSYFLCYYSFVLLFYFTVPLSHHRQGRVHDGDPMGGHDSD